MVVVPWVVRLLKMQANFRLLNLEAIKKRRNQNPNYLFMMDIDTGQSAINISGSKISIEISMYQAVFEPLWNANDKCLINFDQSSLEMPHAMSTCKKSTVRAKVLHRCHANTTVNLCNFVTKLVQFRRRAKTLAQQLFASRPTKTEEKPHRKCSDQMRPAKLLL